LKCYGIFYFKFNVYLKYALKLKYTLKYTFSDSLNITEQGYE